MPIFFLATNMGNLVSANKLVGMFDIKSPAAFWNTFLFSVFAYNNGDMAFGQKWVGNTFFIGLFSGGASRVKSGEKKNATLCFSNELRFIVEVGSRFELL